MAKKAVRSRKTVRRKSAGKRKVAIVGKAPSSALLAPFENPEWEIWILNTLGYDEEVPRWDRQFELHELELTKAPEYRDYYPWLTQQTRPVYLRDEPPSEFRNGRRYPLGEVLQQFRHLSGVNYLTNSISLMIALALLEHKQGDRVKEMGLWGVDMAQQAPQVGHAGWFTSEYARQRPSCEYWIGIAEGMGIPVTIPDTSDLLKTSCIYGYHTTDRHKKFQARQKELAERIAVAQNQEQSCHDKAVYFSGAMQAMKGAIDHTIESCQGEINSARNQEQRAHDEAIFLAGAREGGNYDIQWDTPV